jgi:hypothetical protein
VTITIAAEPRIVGSMLCYYDENTDEEFGWYDSGTKRGAYKTASMGKYIDLGFRPMISSGTAAVAQALSVISTGGGETESANDSLYPDDVDPLVDHALNTWTIDVAGRVKIGDVIVATGPALFLWYHSQAVSYLNTAGHWFTYSSTTGVFTDMGLAKPGAFTASADWTLVDAPGETLIDDYGATYSFGSAAGIGYNGLKNFAVPNYNGMWCIAIKQGDASHIDGNGARIVYHQNPSTGKWIYEITPGTWSGLIDDPEGGGGGSTGDGIVSTTGTISSGVGMNKITVADTSAAMTSLYNAGKLYIGVATGGEATFNGRAGGLRGTVGPGGCWPSGTSSSGSGGRYANVSAMNAGLGSWTTGDHVWVEDSGEVYFHNGSGWQNKNTIGGEDITRHAQPRALIAKVTNISGNVWTLDHTAVVQTTNANVYVDLAKLVQIAWDAASSGTNSDDSGSLAPTTGLGEPFNEAHVTRTVIDLDTIITTNVGSLVDMAWCGLLVGSSKRYITIKSTAGVRIFHPQGTPNQTVEFRSCKGIRWGKNITVAGNYNPPKDQHMNWAGSTGNENFNNGGAQNIISGFQEGSNQCFFYQCTGCVSEDSRGIDALSAPTGGYVSLSCRVYRHRYDQTAPTTTYIWHSQFQVSDDCHFVDCESYSTHVHGGFEHFVSGNVYPCHMIRLKGRNFLISYNDVGNRWWVGEDPNNPGLGGMVVEITASALATIEDYPGWTFINEFNPFIDINTSQSGGNAQLGGFCPNDYVGRIANIRMTVSGLGNSLGDCTGGVRVRGNNRDIFMTNIKYFGQNYVNTARYGGASGCECNGARATFQNWEVRGLSRRGATNWNMFSNNQSINLGSLVVDDPFPQIF